MCAKHYRNSVARRCPRVCIQRHLIQPNPVRLLPVVSINLKSDVDFFRVPFWLSRKQQIRQKFEWCKNQGQLRTFTASRYRMVDEANPDISERRTAGLLDSLGRI